MSSLGKKISFGMMIVLIATAFIGCGVSKEIAKVDTEKETTVSESTEEKEETTEAVTEETTTEDPVAQKEAELLAIKTRARYADVLANFRYLHRLPGEDYYDGEWDMEAMEENQYAIQDIDSDGKEELIISYTTDCMAGMFEKVFGYDENTDSVVEKLSEFPSCTYFSNGNIQAGFSHNQGYGPNFWPYNAYVYNKDTGVYDSVGYVDTWEKEIASEDYEGNPFPEDKDVDKDGVVYILYDTAKDERVYCDKSDYEAWNEQFFGGATEVKINYKKLVWDSWEQYTKDYLATVKEDVQSKTSATDLDMGIMLMDSECDSKTVKSQLESEKGYTFKEIEYEGDTYEKDGAKIMMSYEDAGGVAYEGKAIDNITILGLTPGMDKEEAVEKLKSYGFIDQTDMDDGSSYYFVTGDNGGNYGIYIGIEAGKVNMISMYGHCSYAG